MTFQEFRDLNEEQLNAFEDYWAIESIKEPANFPIELEQPEWEEQFEFFIQNVYER